jgi:hypothetical protein
VLAVPPGSELVVTESWGAAGADAMVMLNAVEAACEMEAESVA